jgi:hypothetical protein
VNMTKFDDESDAVSRPLQWHGCSEDGWSRRLYNKLWKLKELSDTPLVLIIYHNR